MLNHLDASLLVKRRTSSVAPSRRSRYRMKRAGSESVPNVVPRTVNSAKLPCAFAGSIGPGSGAAGCGACANDEAAAITNAAAITEIFLSIFMMSPQERVAGRAVAAVNLLMAVHAAASDDPVAARGKLRAVVNRRGMPRADVAALAEHRRLGDEHPLVVAAVRIVTGVAGLTNRRVIPQERPALFRVAARARLVDPVADLEHPHARRAVRVMAGRAFELALAQRHVPEALRLGHLGLVARDARLAHRRGFELRLLRLRVVHRVARDARQVARVVHAALPLRVGRAVVARHADLGHVARLHRRERAN